MEEDEKEAQEEEEVGVLKQWRSNEPVWVARKAKVLTRFWDMNFPICILLFFLAPPRVMLLYLALVSVYANRVGEASRVQAAESRDS